MESLKLNVVVWKFNEIASTKLAERFQVKTTVAYQQVEPRAFLVGQSKRVP